ncbi:hypothetical protein ISF_00697 [Cordyceps fumosorosea ARSEF 2679]|uniref:Negative acting factor n=1 Tax=Cordyceps fumosorosea (strain ARSEF 2679) TaxID=1081104 RepID=A0A168EH20_CORFA|nr:hypothetical protein ISF_00697 [Cordyceps fumosorosea ARSEF 2679]OAA73796.1 hypothetical protein ISF_00697 [Cordyceps fumosorosea ARSEF 2679]
MVYSGHPSRGCQMCRTRRIKCIKSRRVCPGYKDEFDLVFRNETEATERRARKANNKALALKTGRSTSRKVPELKTLVGSATSSDPSSTPPSTPSSPSPAPTQSLDERTAHHFVSNYVLVPPQGTQRGYFEFVIPLIKAKNPCPHFKLAFEACALAYFSNRMKCPERFEKAALHKYVQALATTGRAIQDPVESKQDGTVAAVLLLSLFENITSRHFGMLAWSTHTEGAIQLVQSRGRDQLKTKVGRDIFVTVRTQQIIHSFSSGQPAAGSTEFWIKDAIKDPFATNLQRITLQISELKTEANKLLVLLHHSPDNVKLIMNILRRCQMKDQELQQWCENLPENYKGKPVTWVNGVPDGDYAKAEVYPGRVDAFQDLWVTTVWVTMRCSRLVLASIIVRAIAWVYSPVDYRTTPEYATWSNTCVSIITDLCAAIPYQLGWFRSRQELLERSDLTSYCCGEDVGAKGLSGYFVTWPLSCIITQDYSTARQREWAKGRLEYIAWDLGVSYAKMLTHVNVRVPSMLIKRDAMAASGSVDTSAVDFEKVLSNRIVPPSGLTDDLSFYGQAREGAGLFGLHQKVTMESTVAGYRFPDKAAH